MNGIIAKDMYPAVIVKALYGNGVKPARKIIKNPCSLNNFLASKKFFTEK